MSRVGKKPIALPGGVKLSQDGATVTVQGPKGSLSHTLNPEVRLDLEGSTATVVLDTETRRGQALHGMTRAVLANMVKGVTEEFSRSLEIQGMGYRAAMEGKRLVLALGYSHPVYFTPPDGITVTTEGQNKVTVRGIDKVQVGQVAANIRSFRPPEPYKGKGIRYEGEYVRRKAGKSAGA
jgi:large subunit ribosomal protein L6